MDAVTGFSATVRILSWRTLASAVRLMKLEGNSPLGVAEGADPALAQDQAELLRYAYDRIVNFKQATYFLAGALFRGFAHVEKVYTGYGNLVSRLEPIEQWYWIRKDRYGDWRFNPENRSHEPHGEAVNRADLCAIHDENRPCPY